MSVDVCLKQKGFFKKAISLSDITNGQFAYGTSESWILVPDKISNDMILYDPSILPEVFLLFGMKRIALA